MGGAGEAVPAAAASPPPAARKPRFKQARVRSKPQADKGTADAAAASTAPAAGDGAPPAAAKADETAKAQEQEKASPPESTDTGAKCPPTSKAATHSHAAASPTATGQQRKEEGDGNGVPEKPVKAAANNRTVLAPAGTSPLAPVGSKDVPHTPAAPQPSDTTARSTVGQRREADDGSRGVPEKRPKTAVNGRMALAPAGTSPLATTVSKITPAVPQEHRADDISAPAPAKPARMASSARMALAQPATGAAGTDSERGQKASGAARSARMALAPPGAATAAPAENKERGAVVGMDGPEASKMAVDNQTAPARPTAGKKRKAEEEGEGVPEKRAKVAGSSRTAAGGGTTPPPSSKPRGRVGRMLDITTTFGHLGRAPPEVPQPSPQSERETPRAALPPPPPKRKVCARTMFASATAEGSVTRGTPSPVADPPPSHASPPAPRRLQKRVPRHAHDNWLEQHAANVELGAQDYLAHAAFRVQALQRPLEMAFDDAWVPAMSRDAPATVAAFDAERALRRGVLWAKLVRDLLALRTTQAYESACAVRKAMDTEGVPAGVVQGIDDALMDGNPDRLIP